MTERPLRILSTSDWHLHHHRVPSAVIGERLRQVLFPLLADADLLFIEGDIFDSAIGLNDPDANDAVAFLLDLLGVCHQHQVTVRVLRGTISHDRTQPSLLPVLHGKYGFTNSLRYFDQVALEEVEPWGLKLLYLPDDLPYASADDVLALVHTKLAELGWDGVDYALGHGYFQEILPPGVPHPPRITYRAEQFTFVRRLVLMGHDHHHAAFANVIYNGSFERLAFGEEHPKGLVRIVDDGTAHATFIPNPHATIFHTVDAAAHDSPDAALALLQERVAALPNNQPVHVRFVHPTPEVRAAALRFATAHWGHVRLTHRAPRNLDNPTAAGPADATPVSALMPLTPEALPELIAQFHATHHPDYQLTAAQVTAMLERLGSTERG